MVGSLDADTLHPIGVVRSELVYGANAPRQGDEGAPDATIEVVPAVHAVLDGIQEGQELIVLTWLHEAKRDVLEVHPRDEVDRPLAGVFGTRSSDRPNPIGLAPGDRTRCRRRPSPRRAARGDRRNAGGGYQAGPSRPSER